MSSTYAEQEAERARNRGAVSTPRPDEIVSTVAPKATPYSTGLPDVSGGVERTPEITPEITPRVTPEESPLSGGEQSQ